MFCNIDDLEQFAKFDKQINLSYKRVEQLFLISIKYDSFKVAFYIDQKYRIKFTKKVIDSIYNSLRDS